MSEDIRVNMQGNKVQKYEELIPQIVQLTKDEPSIIANLANITAALKEVFGWLWVGFYFVDNNKNELVLGPFQGPVACTRISFGKGVCGTSWKEKKSLLVPDVDKFPDHIACSSLSVSEIVVPVFNSRNEVLAVLDVDSQYYDILDEQDVEYLNKISVIVGNMFIADL